MLPADPPFTFFLVCVVPPIGVDGLPDPKETKPHMLEFHVQSGVGFAYKIGIFPHVDYCSLVYKHLILCK